jgi:hypothetical protein
MGHPPQKPTLTIPSFLERYSKPLPPNVATGPLATFENAGQPSPAADIPVTERDRAAILPDGRLVPCVIGRWLDCGNVRDTPLASILAGPEWRRNLGLVPRVNSRGAGCPPASDGEDCPPAQPQCSPRVNYAPARTIPVRPHG